MSLKSLWYTLASMLETVVAAEMAQRPGEPFSFSRFTKTGLPLTIMSLVVTSGFVCLRFL